LFHAQKAGKLVVGPGVSHPVHVYYQGSEDKYTVLFAKIVVYIHGNLV
jgi:hypothetical protein